MMRRHVAAVHEGKRPHVCGYCSKTFSYKCTLATHIKTVHEGQRPHQCPICPANFVDKRNLQTHIDTQHLGKEKEVKDKVNCTTCGSSFSSKYTLEAHIATVHEGKKPFVCTLCDQRFATKGNLSQHIERHHDPKNKITDNARSFVKKIFLESAVTGSDKMGVEQRNALANETVTSMQVAVDENGEALFKAEEYLDSSQIKSLFYTMYVVITCFHDPALYIFDCFFREKIVLSSK